MNVSVKNTKRCQSIELQSSWHEYLEYGYIDWLGNQTMKMVSVSLLNHEYNYESGSPLSSKS